MYACKHCAGLESSDVFPCGTHDAPQMQSTFNMHLRLRGDR